MSNTRGVPCKRCDKPYRSGWPKDGQCECKPIPPSRDRLPALVGVYAPYAEPWPWVYVCRDVAVGIEFLPGGIARRTDKAERYVWDRHGWHQRWIPLNHPRVRVCGYRSLTVAKRALKSYALSKDPNAYIVDASGNRLEV